MRRWIFNTLAALSLLLCLATVVMWVRSFYAAEAFYHWSLNGDFHRTEKADIPYALGPNGGRFRSDGVRPDRGVICVFTRRVQFLSAVQPSSLSTQDTQEFRREGFHGWAHLHDTLQNPCLLRHASPPWWLLGFDLRTEIDTPMPSIPFETKWYCVPYWAVTLTFAILPAIVAARQWRHHRRIRFGRCLNCGYDLRASEGRCPECGTLIDETRYANRSRVA
jgi:hypothetical protein